MNRSSLARFHSVQGRSGPARRFERSLLWTRSLSERGHRFFFWALTEKNAWTGFLAKVSLWFDTLHFSFLIAAWHGEANTRLFNALRREWNLLYAWRLTLSNGCPWGAMCLLGFYAWISINPAPGRYGCQHHENGFFSRLHFRMWRFCVFSRLKVSIKISRIMEKKRQKT